MSERITQLKEHAYIAPVLTSAELAEKGKRAFLDVTTGKATVTMSSKTMDVGEFAETRTGDGTQTVMIRLHSDIVTRRWANDTGTAVAATDVGRMCFIKDASTVSMSSAGGRQRAGFVVAVDSLGVRVMSVMDAPSPMPAGATIAFAAGDIVIADYPRPGTVFDVPTSAANSTITLPANAFEGTEITFVADGTKNGHTVQYRDATGPANLTTALTASKRHQVRAVFLNGKWTASAYVSP